MVEIDQLADAVMQAIETATAPLIARIAVLEKRALVHGRDGKDAPPVDLDVIALKAAALVPKPEPGPAGKDAPAVDVEALAVKAASLVPRPKDGKDGKDVDPDVLGGLVHAKALAVFGTLDVPKDGRDGKDGKDGRDVDSKALEMFIASHVERAVAALPKPADGKSLTPDDVAPLIQAEVTKAAATVKDGRDGVGVAGAVIDHAGVLRLTLTDGKALECGPVHGRDGKDVEPEAVKAWIGDAVARLPVPKDGLNGRDGTNGLDGQPGAPGKDGADGFGFDDFEAVLDEAKGCAVLRFKRGELVKEFPFPWPYDQGVFKPGELYKKLNFVTTQGSLWTAQKDTREQPGNGSKDWRLAVKKGRDGKDGKDAVKEPSDG